MLTHADPMASLSKSHLTPRQKLHPDIDDVVILVDDDPPSVDRSPVTSFRRSRAQTSPFVSKGNQEPGDNLSDVLHKKSGHHKTNNLMSNNNITNVSLINIPKAIIQISSAMERLGFISKSSADRAKKQAQQAMPAHATIDSSFQDDNLKDILDTRDSRLDGLSYDQIRHFKPFDHTRNRRKNLMQLEVRSSPPTPTPSQDTVYKYDTRWGTISIRPGAPAASHVLVDELTSDNYRTFRTVFRMTGQLFRQYVFAPLYRALSRQVAADEAELAAQSQSQSQSPDQSNRRP